MAGAISPVALGNVNDVPFVTDINHGNQFSWQVQYLVRSEVDACCSPYCKRRFICEEDQG